MSEASDQPIQVGTIGQLEEPTGTWLLVDMGFSNSNPSCGVLLTRAPDWRGDGECMTFGKLVEYVRSALREQGDPLHLVLEAPLSGFFDAKGNPLGRASEKSISGQTRYWYTGLGGSLAMASLYLLRNVLVEPPRREVRLFEGFVSFKPKEVQSDHVADVAALRNALVSSDNRACIVPRPVKDDPNARVETILGFLQGGVAEPPPIIIAHPTAAPPGVSSSPIPEAP